MVNVEKLIRELDRKLKLRILQEFVEEHDHISALEFEFARYALDRVRGQPVMAVFAGLSDDGSPNVAGRDPVGS